MHEDVKNKIKEYLYYDESSPSCLRWKHWNRQFNKKSTRYSGDFAGYINSTTDKYSRYKVCIDSNEIMVHQAVLVLHDIEVPDNFQINHIDCNPLNNKISNLEVVMIGENMLKKKMHTSGELASNNKSGVLGVIETTVARPSGKVDIYAHAFIKIFGKLFQRKFNYNKYGKELAWQLAINFREEKYKEFQDAIR